eukprot:8994626-Ditylum_brightwellii.AAC.1
MVNKKVPHKSDGVTLPDGQVKDTSMIGNIPGFICNKNVTKPSGCRITKVKYCKDNVYNLFSFTKSQKKGWCLHGNKKAIWIMKGDQKLVFDIMIPTKDGAIFAAHIQRSRPEEVTNAGTE